VFACRWLLILGTALCVCGPSRGQVADTEVRSFAIQIDGKPAGNYQLTIVQQEDGSAAVTGQADVRVTFALFTAYRYTYRGKEIWKDGRLQRLESTTNDNGKHFSVVAVAEGNNLRVTVNGQQRASRPDVWTTSYWQLPDGERARRDVALLDADTAKDIAGKLEYVETKPITVAGQNVQCAHYRLSGGVQVELWYDGKDRLVREESIEDGHRTVLELTAIRR
jgi:hypothetical protein